VNRSGYICVFCHEFETKRVDAMKCILLIFAAAFVSSPMLASPVAAVADEAKFNGYILVAQGDRVLLDRGFGSRVPGSKGRFSARDLWRWASVSKQIAATLVMQEVSKGTIDLDAPLTRYLPTFAGPTGPKITVRQLLRHQSGLPNPEATQTSPRGIPEYYDRAARLNRDPATGYCAGPPAAAPGGRNIYNNCDYIVLGAVLEVVTGKSLTRLVRTRLAKPLAMSSVGVYPAPKPTVPGFAANKSAPTFDVETLGAGGSLYGTAADLWRFDRALLGGKLLPEKQRAEMWDGKPELGYAALGQWAFPANLKNCTKAVQLIERRGDIGGIQTRNFIVPERDLVMIVFTNRAETDFGEIWQGAGLAHDLLDAALCAAPK
jgi:D-alanyl-D-alanine carboxypeptidase